MILAMIAITIGSTASALAFIVGLFIACTEQGESRHVPVATGS